MGLSGTLRIVEEPWGFSIWKKDKQLGTAVDVSIANVLASLGVKSWIISGKMAVCTLP